MESDLELLGVQRETGKPTMALMGEFGTREYVGTAFVTFGRPLREEFNALVEANTDIEIETSAQSGTQIERTCSMAASRHHCPRSSFARREDVATRKAGQLRCNLVPNTLASHCNRDVQ